ncbi:hypothetical protein VB638_12630 [Dolichospermum sp. UHCC 0684]|jgi:hypothetical protein|uniref:Uncharacterized protein n=1 Tax=Dolichospermum flos-aquae CCAP 1403/13F TaxID=315271 RepID=A0A6H2C181_DOLFA|nr:MULTISPECIES: hypothetical protein [Dolichospermum]MDB9437095.1 hypothetical protein [Dolichospermum lemmermannii CS-548]MEA5530419.1 hypothetical protein [Dolichospermum sp. UHCC 0684]MTJ36665.1 hypothetical protein [Dolichospermum sp. UHCC 0260]QEI40449.1 hypothetical protein BMF77_01018 [Dolichospermum sp. UHCC 0315A]QJB45193.1 hypothetical protein HGD76_14435 [Dolichospermum flos-aquae CCAP 1403/13F]
MQSGDQNLIILMIYILVVYWTINRMIASIDDIVKVDFQKGAVDDQLKAQNLQDTVGISFKTGTYGLDKVETDLKELSMSVENKSDSIAIYVDWDNSSFVVEHSKQSRRVIRKSPDLTRDLAIFQVPTIIAPKKTISENVTAEDVFQRDKESGVYKPASPLINVAGVKGNKKLYKDFLDGKKNLEFSLQLVLRISEIRAGIAPGINVPPVSIINCPFTIKKIPWTYALPWNKK